MPRLLGYVNIFIGIGGVFGAAGLGALYEKFGSYQTPWLIATAALLIVTLVRAYSTAPKRKYDPGSLAGRFDSMRLASAEYRI